MHIDVIVLFVIQLVALILRPSDATWLPGECTPASCNLKGSCYNKIPILNDTNTIPSHECHCFTSYSGANCEVVGMEFVTVGPFPGAFIVPQVAYPSEWKYFYFASTPQRPFPFFGTQVTISMQSWADPNDENQEPCTFIVSTSGSVLLDVPQNTNMEKYDIIVGNGSIAVSGKSIDLITFISVTRNVSSENSRHACMFRIEADADCETLCIQGQCKHGFGACLCDSGWTGRFCDQKLESTQVLWVVVIGVGSALAGITSTIVCCWFIDKKKAKDRAFRYAMINQRLQSSSK